MGFLSAIALVIQVSFGLIILVAFFLHLSEARRYLGVGAVTALLVFTLELLEVAVSSLFLSPAGYIYVLILVLSFLRIMVNTSVGMYYCAALQVPSFAFWERLIRRSFSTSPPAGVFPSPAGAAVEVSPDSSSKTLPEKPSELFQPLMPEPSAVPVSPREGPAEKETINWRPLLLTTLAIAAGGVVFSIILFLLVSPRVADPFYNFPDLEPVRRGQAPSLIINILAMLEAALVEEIAFRMCIQNYLARVLRLPKHGYWLAIVLSTVFWALAHGEMLSPAWFKPVQIFPIGLGLGYLSKRWGVESSILAHAVFNLVLLFLSPWLLGI